MHLKTALSLLTALSIFSQCGDNKKKQEKSDKQDLIPAYSNAGDSLYQSEAIFSARGMQLPIETISKYKLPDSAKLIIPAVAYWIPEYKEPLYTLSAYKGIKYKVELDNKTSISLNSDSKLKFRPDIGQYLELITGEGKFDIKENSTLIKVNDIVDLLVDSGTRINVTAYSDSSKEKTISIALLTGKVRLTSGKVKKELTKAGRKTTIDLSTNNLTEDKFDPADVLAWTNNSFNYNDIDYYSLLKRICRWYDLQLICPPLPNEYVVFKGGNFKQPAQHIISLINSFSYLIECRLEGKKLVVTRK